MPACARRVVWRRVVRVLPGQPWVRFSRAGGWVSKGHVWRRWAGCYEAVRPARKRVPGAAVRNLRQTGLVSVS